MKTFAAIFMITIAAIFIFVMFYILIKDWIKLYKERKNKLTNYEKIKSLNVKQMARFLYDVEGECIVPKPEASDFESCDFLVCNNCKNGLKCYINWLNAKAIINKEDDSKDDKSKDIKESDS